MTRREYGGTLESFTTNGAGLIRSGKDAYFWATRTGGGAYLTDILPVGTAGIVTAGKYVSGAAGAISILGPDGYDADGIWVSADPALAAPRLWLRALTINGTGSGSGGGSGGTVGDATSSVKGLVQLAGDLGGTAASPTVLKLNGATPATVATTGAYADLLGKPTIPTAPGDIGAQPAGSYATTTSLTSGLAAKADLVSGVIPTAQIPALALTNTVAVANQAAMLALTSTQVQPGDIAVRSDGAGTFVLTATDPSQLASWLRLNAPTDVVTTVNGQQGTVVLGKSDVGLGSVDNIAATALRDRSTHTGTQPASTVTGLTTVATTGAITDLSGTATDAQLPARLAATALDATYAQRPAGGTDGQALVKAGAGTAWATLGGTGTAAPATSQTPLARFFAALATRDAAPVIVSVDGDSYSQSFGAGYWADRLSVRLQTRYPRIDGSASPAPSSDASVPRSSRGVGVQILNTAIGGATSANFQSDSNERSLVAAQRPALYLWMIGTNDLTNNISPAAHKANIQAAITYHKANNPAPAAFLLVHAYQRMDSYTSAYNWPDYLTVEQEIVATDPTNVLSLDLAAPFALAGVPGADPYALVGSDKLHPADPGYCLIADLIFAALTAALPLTATATIPAPVLTSTAAPALSGTAATGSTLTTSNGTWSATPDSYTYQWRRAGTAISGATASTYTLVTADETKAITCTVTAVKAGYSSGSVASNAVTPPATGTPALSNTTAPAITGTPTTGQTLTVSNGTWSATPDSYTYQWKRAGANITGATASTYVLVQADETKAITCTVTATKSGYTSATATSNTVTPAATGGGGSTTSGTDTFNRADASTLGTPSDGGSAYTVTGTWGIASGMAYQTSTGQAWALRPLRSDGAGVANATVEYVLGNATNRSMTLPLIDYSNPAAVKGYVCFLGLSNQGDAALWRYDGGYAGIGSFGNVAWAAGDFARLVKTGSSFNLYRNGVLVGTVMDATYASVTHAGLFAYQTTSARIDALTFSTP